MIAYNVTVNVEADIEKEWVEWMKTVHIPEVLATGMFESYKMFRLLTVAEDETGATYAIQYFAPDMTSYEKYQEEHAPRLQAETRKKYEGKFVAFRSVMEQV